MAEEPRVQSEIDRQIAETEALERRERAKAEIAVLLREAIAIAKTEAEAGREPYNRQMAVTRTSMEGALLYCLFGDRV